MMRNIALNYNCCISIRLTSLDVFRKQFLNGRKYSYVRNKTHSRSCNSQMYVSPFIHGILYGKYHGAAYIFYIYCFNYETISTSVLYVPRGGTLCEYDFARAPDQNIIVSHRIYDIIRVYLWLYVHTHTIILVHMLCIPTFINYTVRYKPQGRTRLNYMIGMRILVYVFYIANIFCDNNIKINHRRRFSLLVTGVSGDVFVVSLTRHGNRSISSEWSCHRTRTCKIYISLKAVKNITDCVYKLHVNAFVYVHEYN